MLETTVTEQGPSKTHPLYAGSEQVPSTQAEDSVPAYVIAIGASAGAFEAIISFLKAVPKDHPYGIVILQHLSPNFDTKLPEIFTRHTGHQVKLAEDGMFILSGSVVLIPPNRLMSIFHGRLLLESIDQRDPQSYFPIDHFLTSLANDMGERAIAVIMSGTGSDGAAGVREVHRQLGYVVCQSPDSAKFSGMPRSAIDTRCVNVILDVKDMIQYINDYSDGIGVPSDMTVPPADPERSETAVDKIFFLLRHHVGIDFASYRSEIVERRVERRMQIGGMQSFDEYAEYLSLHHSEIEDLCKDLLLGVTEFYRHPEDLVFLKEVCLPRLVRAVNDRERDGLRIWVAGCSTGEEAFTIAMILADVLEETSSQLDFKIFATDVDEKSLRIASRATFPEARLDKLDQGLRKYFNMRDGYGEVVKRIRERVIFARHNVLKDAPFPDIDLVLCRNLFIYLKQTAKMQTLNSFRFSLKNEGFLLLGPSESIPDACEGFSKLNESTNIYQCVIPMQRFTKPNSSNSASKEDDLHKTTQVVMTRRDQEAQFAQRLLEKLAKSRMTPCLIVNRDLVVQYFLGDVKKYLQPVVGKASHALDHLVAPEVCSVIEGMVKEVEDSTQNYLERTAMLADETEHRLVSLSVNDLQMTKNDQHLYMITFSQRERGSTLDLEGSDKELLFVENQQLKTQLAQRETELSQLRAEMGGVVGQLEASNEEYRTANEELQAGHEELQSTNEELQAVNEELYTVNAECQLRINELSEINNEIHNIYEVSNIGTIFVDRNLRIRKFNRASQKIFHLLPDDVGRPLGHFSPAVKIDFAEMAKSVMQRLEMAEVEMTSVDGLAFLTRVAPYRADNLEVKGVVFVFIEISKFVEGRKELKEARRVMDLLAGDIEECVLHCQPDGKIVSVNKTLDDRLGELSPLKEDGQVYFADLFDPECKDIIDSYLALSAEQSSNDFGLKVFFQDEQHRKVWVNWYKRHVVHEADGEQLFMYVGKAQIEDDMLIGVGKQGDFLGMQPSDSVP